VVFAAVKLCGVLYFTANLASASRPAPGRRMPMGIRIGVCGKSGAVVATRGCMTASI